MNLSFVVGMISTAFHRADKRFQSVHTLANHPALINPFMGSAHFKEQGLWV